MNNELQLSILRVNNELDLYVKLAELRLLTDQELQSYLYLANELQWLKSQKENF